MKYKVGNFVRIKYWEELEEEFGVRRGYIKCKSGNWGRNNEEMMNKYFPDRIVEIKKADLEEKENPCSTLYYYTLSLSGVVDWWWKADRLEEIGEIVDCSIRSRFDILDIRN